MYVDCAYRYRFYPTPEQADLLTRSFGCARVVYNRAREARETAWRERKESFGFLKTNAMLTALKKDPAFAWLNEVSCVPLQQALRHLDAAYQAFFREMKKPKGQRRKIGYPGFRSKHGTQAAEFTKSAFNYRDGVLKLAKMAQPLKVVWSRPLSEPPSTVTVIREADGRWYIACRINRKVEPLIGGGAVGIDLGLAHLATLSTGEKIDNPRHLRKRLRKLALLQRRAARKRKGSKNRAKASLKVARAHAAVRDARQDFLHKLTTRLVRENQTLCVEDLCVKGMVKNRKLARSISDAGWGEFLRMLAYKSGWYGRTLVVIDRFFPSTKTCGECGTTGHKLSLSDRNWTCPDCGALHDRDVNAAKNILTAGLAAVNACRGNVRPVAA